MMQELPCTQSVGTALLIDEVSFHKKGKHSACVSRQYLGCLGKVDNGQVAVALCLSKGSVFSPIDIKLFMPQSWENDDYRRKKCHIPEAEKHVSKPKMAVKMTKKAKKQGVDFSYVNFDSLYGSSYETLLAFENESIPFIGDVKSNRLIYLDNNLKEGIKLCEYFKKLNDSDFERITIRQGTKQRISAYYHQKT